MSSVADHKAKAESNERLATLLKSPNEDWTVIVLFYAALHYVEAHFAKNNPPLHSPNHEKRDASVARSPILKPQWKNYRELKNQSRLARYEAHIKFGNSDIVDAAQRLEAIKKVILPTL